MDRNDFTRIGRLGLIMLLAGTPTLSHALGLGKLKVKSTLDEPLDAEIDLSAVQAGEFEAIQIKLATRKEFDEAAIDRPAWLTNLQFEPARRADGRPFIKVRTADTVNEPYVQFLLSVQWPGGKVVREYTALLNPPVYAETTGATITAPTVVAEPAPIPQTPVTTPRPAVATSAASENTRIAGDSGVGDYSVQAGDTLWSIASSIDVPEGVTLYQVMLSILRQNPDAFVNGNMNRLRNKEVLQLPGLQDMQAVSDEAARDEYVAQLETWEVYRRAVAGNASNAAQAGDSTAAAGEADTNAATAANTNARPNNGDQQTQQPTPKDIIRIVQAKPGESVSGADQSNTDGVMRERVGALEEELAARQAENTDLQDQVGELQSQIEKFQRLIELRNTELAQLQQNLTNAESERTQVQETLTDIENRELADQLADDPILNDQIADDPIVGDQNADNPDSVITADMEQTLQGGVDATDQGVDSIIDTVEKKAGALGDVTDDASGALADAANDASKLLGDAGDTVSDTVGAATDAASDTAAGLIGGAKNTLDSATDKLPETLGGSQADSTTKSAIKKVGPTNPPPRPQADGPWYETAMNKVTEFFNGSDTKLVAMIAAGIAALVALFVWFRRRKSIAEFEESILSGSALDIQTETTETGESTAATDTSFLSEFGVPGMGTMQADEVDPIAEAEVYMAYGRDEQAEEVLKEAIARDNNRPELKLKLLEIYQQRNDLKEFETLAEELYPAGGDNDNAVWDQVVDMGRKMNPDNPLFKGGVVAGAGAVAAGLAGDFESTADNLSPFPTPELDDSDDQRLAEMADEAERTHPRLDPFAKDDDADNSASLIAEDGGLDLDSDDLDLGFDFADGDDGLPDDLDLDLGSTGDDDDDGLGLGAIAGLTGAAGAVGAGAAGLLGDAKDSAADGLESLTDLGGDLASGAGDMGADIGDMGSNALDSTLDGLSLDLDGQASNEDDLSFDLSMDSAVDGAKDTLADDLNLDSDFDLNLAAVDDAPDLSVVEGGLEAGDESWSEAATKLDLAKAYIDMGDRSGAQSIIQEVLKEGNEGQRKQAQELAEQLTATG